MDFATLPNGPVEILQDLKLQNKDDENRSKTDCKKKNTIWFNFFQ